MADENIESGNEPVELSPIEQKASEQGWVPQDQWSGNPDDWRPAKEFVDRGELFKKIDEVRRENKQLRQGHDELFKHHQRVRQLAYEQALSDLKAQKKAALADGDVDAVVEIDDRIDAQKEAARNEAAQAAQAQAAQAPTTVDPIFEAWSNKNSWYERDRAMKAYADEVARETFLRGTKDKELILDAVEKAVKKEFAHKFENPRRNAPSSVEGGSNKKLNTTRETDAGFSDAERQIMNKILRVTPGMTKEQYLKEYKEANQGRGSK